MTEHDVTDQLKRMERLIVATRKELSRARVANMVLYGFAFIACAAAGGAAVLAYDKANEANNNIKRIQELRRLRIADQGKTDRQLCLADRASLGRHRATKRALSTDTRIFLQLIRSVAATTPASQRLPLTRAVDDLTSQSQALRAQLREIDLELNGDPSSRDPVKRKGLQCGALPSTKPFEPLNGPPQSPP